MISIESVESTECFAGSEHDPRQVTRVTADRDSPATNLDGTRRPPRTLTSATPAPATSTQAPTQPSQPMPYSAPRPATSNATANSTAQLPAAYPAQSGQ